jgi:hypothetical protein
MRSPGGIPGNQACSLLTPAELQEALGARVSGLDGGATRGDTAICMGATPTATVMLRTASIPPKSMEEHGFNTTCTVLKGTRVGGVEVTAKAQKDMIPIEKLRTLAEKIGDRL